MSTELGNFFSAQSEADQQKIKDMVNNAPSENKMNKKIEYAGSYVVQMGEFVWYNKKDPKKPTPTPSPEVIITRENALQLQISLNVCDEGTDVVPKGSSIFHTITLVPKKGSNETKIENTLRYMKPQLTALLGHDKIVIDEKWIKENCTIDWEEKNGKPFITRHHKMTKQVYVTLDFKPDQNDKPKLQVVKIDKLMPGDKSITRKYNEQTNTAPTSSIPAEVDISPTEEVKPQTARLNTSKVIVEDF